MAAEVSCSASFLETDLFTYFIQYEVFAVNVRHRSYCSSSVLIGDGLWPCNDVFHYTLLLPNCFA